MGCGSSTQHSKDIRQIQEDIDAFSKYRTGMYENEGQIVEHFDQVTAHHFNTLADTDVQAAVAEIRREHDVNGPIKEMSQQAAEHIKQCLEQLAIQWDSVAAARDDLKAKSLEAQKVGAQLAAANTTANDPLVKDAEKIEKNRQAVTNLTAEAMKANHIAEASRADYELKLNTWNQQKKAIMKNGMLTYYTAFRTHMEKQQEVVDEVIKKINAIDTEKYREVDVKSVEVRIPGWTQGVATGAAPEGETQPVGSVTVLPSTTPTPEGETQPVGSVTVLPSSTTPTPEGETQPVGSVTVLPSTTPTPEGETQPVGSVTVLPSSTTLTEGAAQEQAQPMSSETSIPNYTVDTHPVSSYTDLPTSSVDTAQPMGTATTLPSYTSDAGQTQPVSLDTSLPTAVDTAQPMGTATTLPSYTSDAGKGQTQPMGTAASLLDPKIDTAQPKGSATGLPSYTTSTAGATQGQAQPMSTATDLASSKVDGAWPEGESQPTADQPSPKHPAVLAGNQVA